MPLVLSEARYGMRQLAAALKHRLTSIVADEWAVHTGASKLVHPTGFARSNSQKASRSGQPLRSNSLPCQFTRKIAGFSTAIIKVSSILLQLLKPSLQLLNLLLKLVLSSIRISAS